MLAKMWKKVLLAVCIIACLFNIMSKLVNRHSLEANLNSANDGNTVLDAITEKDNTIQENNIIHKPINGVEIERNQDSVTSEEQNQQRVDKNQDAIDSYTDYIITF